MLKLLKTWIESDQASSRASVQASTQTSVSTPVPAPPPPLRRVIQGSPRDLAIHHARLLLERIRNEHGPGSHVILVDDLKALYREMCFEKKLRERPWNMVAAAFAKLIRQPGRSLKTYSHWIDHRGAKRRRRVYYLLIRTSVSFSWREPPGAWQTAAKQMESGK